MADITFKWVRSIYGSGDDAQKKYNYIPDGGMNDIIKTWHSKRPERGLWCSPSNLLTCPRVVWLMAHNVPPTNEMGWGTKQRMMAGRMFEDLFAQQLEAEGKLLYHWKDGDNDNPEKFTMGEGDTLCTGVPDYLLNLNGDICISDAKTSRSDSFGYVPIEAPEIWQDGGWKKYKLQLTAYFMLCVENRQWLTYHSLPIPSKCHLFSYALDDGIVRREFLWEPTQEDKLEVVRLTKRFNQAMQAKDCPACTCQTDSPDGFFVKFCKYGVANGKVCESCCSDNLISKGEQHD